MEHFKYVLASSPHPVPLLFNYLVERKVLEASSQDPCIQEASLHVRVYGRLIYILLVYRVQYNFDYADTFVLEAGRIIE